MPQWESWPANRIDLEELIFPHPPQVFLGDGRRMVGVHRSPVLAIRRERDHGQRYEMRPAAWRDWAERLNPPQLGSAPVAELLDQLRDPLRSLVAKFGPPFFIDRAVQPFDFGSWLMFRDLLALVRLWTQPDEAGVSWFQDAQTLHEKTEADGVRGFLLNSLRSDSVPSDSLVHFMMTEALRFVDQKPTMKLCSNCGFWFARGRSDQRHCNAVCRRMASRKGL
jgi:hypothetical protein